MKLSIVPSLHWACPVLPATHDTALVSHGPRRQPRHPTPRRIPPEDKQSQRRRDAQHLALLHPALGFGAHPPRSRPPPSAPHAAGTI
ncbi:hypothetical protein C8J57DRAFT_1483880, partial [Mycena rebaudengoi]